jgi:predicted GNAT family N-acyltransferase
MEIRRVTHGSADYNSLIELRRRLLKIPIGIDFTADDLEAESCDVFLGAFDGAEAVGSSVLTVKEASEVQMRQVTVAEARQGHGIGKLLVRESERVATESGFAKVIVSARIAAVPFYESLGYDLVGEEYTEVGIPHRRLEKALTSP